MTSESIAGSGGGGTPRARAGSTWRIDLAILLVALAVRGIHLAGLLGDPLFDAPRVDPRYHDAWARRIVAGEVMAERPFFRAPLYAYLLAAIYAASGGSILAARAVQLALGALLPVLVWRLGRRTLGGRVGLGGGLVAASEPLALRFEGDLLLEGPFVLLVIAALWLLVRTLARPTRRGWLVTGVLFGLAAITRPNILAFVVVLPLAVALGRGWWWRARAAGAPRGRSRAAGARRGVASPLQRGEPPVAAPFPRGTLPPAHELLLVAAGVVLPILPVFAHNVAAGDPVPIATQAGVNFYIGNNPQADGFTAIVPGTRATWWGGHDDAVALAEQACGRSLAASEVSHYWLTAGLHFIAAHPAQAAAQMGRKLYLFWWGAEISNNEHVYFVRRYSWPLRLLLWHRLIYMPFGLIAPLALVGMALAAARRPRARLLLVYVLAYMGSVVLFFVCSRFRFPVVPVLLLFAVYAVSEIARGMRAGARAARRAWLLAGAVALIAVPLNADLYGLNPAVFGSQALSYLDLGTDQARRGAYAEALASLREAARLDPGHPGPHAVMGWVDLKTGRYEEAEAELRLATRGDPVLFRDVVVRAERDLGWLYLHTDRAGRADAAYRAALALRPGDGRALVGAGRAARALGRSQEARALFERALELDPADARARRQLELLEEEQ